MTKKIQTNQNCAEVMFIKAVQLVMNQNLTFQYDKEIQDAQVDLGPAFMSSPDVEKQIWYSGKQKATLEADLHKLDKNKVYFLRTGTNGGAGHWQNLFFGHQTNAWTVHSSDANNYQVMANNALTKAGEALLAVHANWGPGNGQYAFLIVEASQQNLINGANYLYDFRTQGADVAMMNAFVQQNDFYAPIKNPITSLTGANLALANETANTRTKATGNPNNQPTVKNDDSKAKFKPDTNQKMIDTFNKECEKQIIRLNTYRTNPIAKEKRQLLITAKNFLAANQFDNFVEHIQDNEQALRKPHSSIPKSVLKGILTFVGCVLGGYPGYLLYQRFFSDKRSTTTGDKIVTPALEHLNKSSDFKK